MPQPAENTNTVLQSCPQTRSGARHSAVTRARTSAFKSNKQHLESTVSPALGGGTYNQWDNVSLTDNIIPAENFRACTETQKCRKCQSCTWGQVSVSTEHSDLWASGVALLLCSSRWLHAWIKYVSQVAKDLKYYNSYLIWSTDEAITIWIGINKIRPFFQLRTCCSDSTPAQYVGFFFLSVIFFFHKSTISQHSHGSSLSLYPPTTASPELQTPYSCRCVIAPGCEEKQSHHQETQVLYHSICRLWLMSPGTGKARGDSGIRSKRQLDCSITWRQMLCSVSASEICHPDIPD